MVWLPRSNIGNSRRAAILLCVAVLAGLATAGSEEANLGSQPRYWLPSDAVLPAGRTADWSYAGYQGGDQPIPVPGRHYDAVEDFGAKGDGAADDTAALQAAIAAANADPGVVYLPRGTYRLSQPLTVNASGVVIRGAGEDATHISVSLALGDVYPGTWSAGADGKVSTQWGSWGGFIQFSGLPEYHGSQDTWLASVTADVQRFATSIPVDGASFQEGQWVRVFAVSPSGQELGFSAKVAAFGRGTLQLDRQLPFPVIAGQGSVHTYRPTVQEGGVEQLTIVFDSGKYGAHESDRGFNAIMFASVANCWLQQVTIQNADNAIVFDRVDHTSVLDVTIESTYDRADPADNYWLRQGHHGILLSDCHSVMVGRFRIASRYYHDLAVTNAALLNVFSGGSAQDLCILNWGEPQANLFTDLDAGLGSRIFSSDGGSGAGFGTTFYNLRSEAAVTKSADGSDSAAPAGPQLPSCDYGSDLVFVVSFDGALQCSGWDVAALNDSLPNDLYSSQLFSRNDAPPVLEGAERARPTASYTACRTFMGNSDDPVECWDLVYDHCIPGYTNRNAIPKTILYHEHEVIEDVFDVASRTGSFGDPPHMPLEYSRVCVARPSTAGWGNCAHVEAGDYRVHMLGFQAAGGAKCDNTPYKTNFVKAHVDGSHHFSVWGNVGH